MWRHLGGLFERVLISLTKLSPGKKQSSGYGTTLLQVLEHQDFQIIEHQIKGFFCILQLKKLQGICE
jgi:hypothetical protein